eukprot:3540642-Prymnesium_polylepis.1
MSIGLKILTSPMSANFGTASAIHQEGQLDNEGAIGSYVVDSATGKGVRMDHRHSGLHSPRPCGLRVAVDVVLGSLAEMSPEGGATGVITTGVGGNKGVGDRLPDAR